MKFFLGTHHPHWLSDARFTDVPLFVSHRQLSRYKTPPRAVGSWALDSGGFTELSMHGRWTLPAAEYAREDCDDVCDALDSCIEEGERHDREMQDAANDLALQRDEAAAALATARREAEAYAAQLAPMARAVDALRAAAVAAGHPAADVDPDAQFCAVRAAAWNAGAEAMRAEAAEVAAGSWATHPAHRGMRAASRAVADEILSLPVPPCPWGVCCGTGEVSR